MILFFHFSPLTGVDTEDVGMFLIQLTNRDFLQSKPENVDELDNCHDAIAYTLCNQIIAEPLSFHVKLYTKLLGNLYISMDSVTRLRELKALSQQMNEVVKDKVYLKSLEKFGKKVEAYLEQHPNEDDKEDATPVEPEPQTQDNMTTMNNTTKLFRKRPLFSQTANHDLLEGQNVSTPPPASTIKDLVEKNLQKSSESEDDDEDIFATPKRVTNLQPSGEIEITRIEESPLEISSDEIVSGTIKSKKPIMVVSDDDDDSDEVGPTTSTQIERRLSKRINSSATSTTEDEDGTVRGKRTSKGGKVKPVKPSKPQRKSRRLDSSTGSSTEGEVGKPTTKKRSRK